MPEERLQWLRNRLAEHPAAYGQEPDARGSYGLRNVNKRLALHYGRDAGLQVESAEGAGTRITFRIPIVQEAKEWTREQSSKGENEDEGYDR